MERPDGRREGGHDESGLYYVGIGRNVRGSAELTVLPQAALAMTIDGVLAA
jgi:hypothetical protein